MSTVNDVVSALGLHGVPELFMLPNEDVERYRGKKPVLAIMASNRNHPEFSKAEQVIAKLKDKDDLIIITEDHADGPLHERFGCRSQEFLFALLDKTGNILLQGECIPNQQLVRDLLARSI